MPKIGSIAPEAVDRRAQGADTGKQSLMPTRRYPWQTAACRLGWTSHAPARPAMPSGKTGDESQQLVS